MVGAKRRSTPEGVLHWLEEIDKILRKVHLLPRTFLSSRLHGRKKSFPRRHREALEAKFGRGFTVKASALIDTMN